jgi:hypothetical protein
MYSVAIENVAIPAPLAPSIEVLVFTVVELAYRPLRRKFPREAEIDIIDRPGPHSSVFQFAHDPKIVGIEGVFRAPSLARFFGKRALDLSGRAPRLFVPSLHVIEGEHRPLYGRRHGDRFLALDDPVGQAADSDRGKDEHARDDADDETPGGSRTGRRLENRRRHTNIVAKRISRAKEWPHRAGPIPQLTVSRSTTPLRAHRTSVQ